jgi:hypothetical protein
VDALRLLSDMSMGKTEVIMHRLGEAGVISHLGKFLELEQCDLALTILRLFENRIEYYPQLLSIGLLNLAKVSQDCETLFISLCHHASPDQLIPIFSYFLSQFLLHPNTSHPLQMLLSLIDSPTLDLTQVLPHLDVGKILCKLSGDEISQDFLEKLYKILSSIYLRDSGAVIVTESHLLSWQLFLSQGTQDNLRLELIGPILLKIVTSCSDLKSIIDHELISSVFSRVQTCHSRDSHFLQWFLDLINFVVSVRAQENGRQTEAVLFVDHLVELGTLSFLIESLSLNSPDRWDGVLSVLKLLFRFDKNYHKKFKETPIMKCLLSLAEENDKVENQ